MKKTSRNALTLGCLAVAICIVSASSIREIQVEKRLSTVNADWDILDKAIKSLGHDNCGLYLPSDTSWRSHDRPTFESEYLLVHPHAPTASSTVPHTRSLTTPFAYIDKYPTDPFNPGQGYGFVAWSFFDNEPPFALLHSPGPDGDIDIRIERIFLIMNDVIEGIDYFKTPRSKELMAEMIARFNSLHRRFACEGIVGDGDLFRLVSEIHETPPTDIFIDESALESLLEKFPSDARIPIPRWDRGTEHAQFDPDNKELTAVKQDFFDHFGQYLTGDTTDPGHLMHSLANHLAPWADFFNDPRPLSPDEIEVLEQWKQSDPYWWRVQVGERDEMIEKNGYLYSTSIDIEFVYVEVENYIDFLVYFGKSRLVNCAGLIGQDDVRAANRQLGMISHHIHALKNYEWQVGVVPPKAKRVADELSRMRLILDRLNKARAEVLNVDLSKDNYIIVHEESEVAFI